MNIKVYPQQLKGTVEIAASKSVAHRMMICSALSEKGGTISAIMKGTDIEATANCLAELGTDIQILENKAIVTPVYGEKRDICKLYCKDSGSTFRFMLPLVAALGCHAEFSGTERLASRPVSELREVLSAHGITFSADTLPFEISGKLESGIYEIDASISSQYVTGLLLALPLLKGDSQIILKNRVVSSDYIKITLDVMKLFGVEVETTENGFLIKGSAKYVSPETANCEGDWSSACFFAVAGGIGGGVSLENISMDSLQGDKAILEFINETGGSFARYINRNGVDSYTFGSSANLKAGVFHTENTPDVVPILAVLCSFCGGTSEIVGISRLKDKESDRLSETIKMLDAFGISAFTGENSLYVTGGSPVGGKYHVPDDHRMAMAAVIMATYASGESEIYDIDCISKSYPHFLENFARLGGKFDVLGI
ncbi:MAG: 3-phosphoshikimate 1-carboxyvinyltransferase [Bacillota bacterium]